MKVTLIGIISILVAIFFLLSNYRNLLLCCAFCTPFTATSVFEFENFYIQPLHFFLLLYMIAWILESVGKGKLVIKKPNAYLVAFIFIAILSIIACLLSNRKVLVYGIGNGLKLKYSTFSFQNLTQLLYLISTFLLYCFIYDYCCYSEVNSQRIRNVIICSGVVVSFIGLYQLVAYRMHWPYDVIFRNSVDNLWQIKSRMQATMSEASLFGQFIAVELVFFISGKSKFHFIEVLIILLFSVCGILSVSTTFLLTIGCFLIAFFWLNIKNYRRISKLLVSFWIAIFFLNLYNSNLLIEIITKTIGKLTLNNVSGIERNEIFWHMVDVGNKNFLLGVGYGSGRSTDLYSSIYATVGGIGLIVLIAYFFNLFIRGLKLKKEQKRRTLFCLGAIIISSCAVPDLCYTYIWVILANIESLKIDENINLINTTTNGADGISHFLM